MLQTVMFVTVEHSVVNWAVSLQELQIANVVVSGKAQ